MYDPGRQRGARMFDDRALRALLFEVVRQVLREERPKLEPSEYLSVADAAEWAAVTPQTIRTWMGAGRLGRYRAGRELRVKAKEPEELLKRVEAEGAGLEARLAEARAHLQPMLA